MGFLICNLKLTSVVVHKVCRRRTSSLGASCST